MFKCPICNQTYENVNAAIKCINSCGRKKFNDGVFQTKPSKYKGEIININYDFEFNQLSLIEIFQQLEHLLSPQEYFKIQYMTYNNWDRLSSQEKENRINCLILTTKIYINSNKNSI